MRIIARGLKSPRSISLGAMQRIELAVASVCDAVKGPRPDAFKVLAVALNLSTVIDERHGRLRLTVHTNNATCYWGVIKQLMLEHRGRHTSVHIIQTNLSWGLGGSPVRNPHLHPFMLSQQHYDSWEQAVTEQPAPDVFAYLEDDNAIYAEELLAWWHDTQLLEARGLLASGFHRDLCRMNGQGPADAAAALGDVRTWARLGPMHPGCSRNYTCEDDVCVHFPLVYMRDGRAHRIFATATNAYSGVTIATRKQTQAFLAWRRQLLNSSAPAVHPEPLLPMNPGGHVHDYRISASRAPPTKLVVAHFERYYSREFGACGYQYSQRSLEMSPWVNAAENWWPKRGGFVSDEPVFRALVPVKTVPGRYYVEDTARVWHLGLSHRDRHSSGGKIRSGQLAKCYAQVPGPTAENSSRWKVRQVWM